jgi:hypothetical protein
MRSPVPNKYAAPPEVGSVVTGEVFKFPSRTKRGEGACAKAGQAQTSKARLVRKIFTRTGFFTKLATGCHPE